MHARGIGGENVAVTGLAGNRVHILGRAFDHDVGRMATGTKRGDRVAFVNEGRMDALLPLPELIAMTVAADLDHRDGKFALGADGGLRRRMTGQVDVGMAAGAPDRAVDRLREDVAGYVQRERFAVCEMLLDAR